ncbi:MAG: ATP-binding protein [Pseudomonadota bacterium]
MDSLRKIVKPGGGSIAQQVMLLLLAALVIANVVSIFIIAAQPPPQRQVADFSQAIARLKTALPQVEGASGGGLRAKLEKISDRRLQFSISRDLPPRTSDVLAGMTERRAASELGVAPERVRANLITHNGLLRQLLKDATPSNEIIDAIGFVGPTQLSVRLSNNEWVTTRMARQTDEEVWLRTTFLSFIGATLVLTPLGLLFARRLASPIGEFAEAAEQLGRNPDAPLLEEKGPHELRSAVRAFNTMQERLRKFVEGRTLMMAAISHDLRTPLQRLRFRIDSLDEEARNQMLADIEEMEAMIGSTLAFASDEAAPAARQTLDLGALVSSVCDEAADAGGAAQCAVQARVVVQGDPVRLKRALSNLVYNAMKYAGGAEVRVGHEMGAAIVEVADRGPGIPAERLEEMFQPFRRLEPSRSRATGGAGLGLSIARTIARAHGGDVTLSPRPGGGLMARMALPA